MEGASPLLTSESRMNLFTTEQIAALRRNVHEYEAAQSVARDVIAEADRWVDRSESFIHERMPDGRVPRALAVNYVTGCPIHGGSTVQMGLFGQDNWIIDVFDDPWKVTCRTGGESYPSNDFGAFYRTGMTDRSLLTGDFPDDGHGWLGEGQAYRHWFVAYACSQMWYASINGLEALARASVLTDDDRYAQQALRMLERLADVYGGMDYRISMYATEMSPGYSGKIHYQIGETVTVYRLACAFDLVRDAASPTARTHIETGLLREMLRGVYEGHARGNYAMHQLAAVSSAMALSDEAELARAIDWTLNNAGEASRLKEMRTSFDDYIFRDRAAHAEGLNWAWHNLMFREGIGWESSPSYCGSWITELFELALLLDRAGADVWDEPKMRRMLDWPLEMASFNASTPAVGDAGSIKPSVVPVSRQALRSAYQQYSDAALAARLLERGIYDEGSFSSFGDLLFPVLTEPELAQAAAGEALGPMRDLSRLMGGYGLAMLRQGRGEDGVAASVYYGRAATEHAHFDRLNLELYAYGRKLIPDLGYPIHAGEGSEPALWTKNTAAHATVVVDESRQTTQAGGRARAFVSAPQLQYLEIDAARAYHQTSTYGRSLVMAGVGPGPGESDAAGQHHYLIDLFDVHGGTRHDYSLHGFDALFSVDGLQLSDPAPGTLAGEDVAYGTAYDDPDLDRPHRTRAYYTYAGSGYSYLTNVQRARPADGWTATWEDGEVGLRVHALPWSHDEVIIADGAYPERQPDRHFLKYLIMRHDGDPAISMFATVLEPYKVEPFIRNVTALSANPSDGPPGPRELRVAHAYGSDTWALHPAGRCAGDTRLTRVSRDKSGGVVRVDVIGTGEVETDGCHAHVGPGLSGRITAVNDERHTVEITLDGASASDVDLASVAGQTALIGNPRHGTTYTVVAAQQRGTDVTIQFPDDSFCIGRFRVGPVAPDGGAVITPTYLYLAAQGYYRGTCLVNEAGEIWHEVDDVLLTPHKPGRRRDGRIMLRDPAGPDLAAQLGDVASLYDFGPGDRLEIMPHAHAVRRSDGGWTMSGFGQFEVS